jgi:hypothetical protein
MDEKQKFVKFHDNQLPVYVRPEDIDSFAAVPSRSAYHNTVIHFKDGTLIYVDEIHYDVYNKLTGE